MQNRLHEFYSLEELSSGDTFIHRLHPAAKLLAAAAFIMTVASFDRYAFGRLAPYVFYPAILMVLSGTPFMPLLKRFAAALPFCFFAGISNIIFDRTSAFVIEGISVSYGAVSFCVILLRAYLCVTTVLVLVSVTPFWEISKVMRGLRMPDIFIIIFEMTYRYIGVLITEAYSMYTAYSLRNSGKKGIEMRDMGAFAGQLLLRSIDRAERVYNAMKCRAYNIQSKTEKLRGLKGKDFIFLSASFLFFAAFRFYDPGRFFAPFFGGAF